MSAPLVVNTRDGVCWTRRTVTSGGIALYAPERVKTCPGFVMATLEELAEQGIVGSAFALPVPVGPEPVPQGPGTFRFTLDIEGATDREDASWAAEQAVSAVEGQGYKAFTAVVDEDAHYRAAFEAQRSRAETLDRLLRTAQGRVAELESERHSTNEALSDAAEALRANRDRIAQADAQRQALAERLRAGQQWQRGRNPDLVSENYVSQSELRAIFGIPLTAPWDDEEDCDHPNGHGPYGCTGCGAATPADDEDDEGLSGPCDCGEGAIHYTAASCPAEQRQQTEETR